MKTTGVTFHTSTSLRSTIISARQSLERRCSVHLGDAALEATTIWLVTHAIEQRADFLAEDLLVFECGILPRSLHNVVGVWIISKTLKVWRSNNLLDHDAAD